MKLGRVVGALTLTGTLLLACSTKTIVTDGAPNQPGPNDGAEGDGGTPNAFGEEPENQPPHALGTITLGETHASGSGSAVPVVSVSFWPDAKSTKSCTKKVEAGCELTVMPKCTDVNDSYTGCNTGESCTLDDACAPVCKKTPVCKETCEQDEICTLDPSDKNGTKGTCVKQESFDAGPIAFSGTTTPITMFPPYTFDGDGKGAPFLAGAEIRVQAQGATEAGFEAFDEKFAATTFLQTSPALSKIPREKVFGTGPLPIAWAPGADRIDITLSGAGGMARCTATDALGKFDVPRSVLDAVLGDASNGGTPMLSLSVSRTKRDVRKDKKTKGTLKATPVQPVGWLEVATMSNESATFQGCSAKQTICGAQCSDLHNDDQNCGSCGHACPDGQTCTDGRCATTTKGCQQCSQGAQQGACAAQTNACLSDASCTELAGCLQNCADAACRQTCQTQNAAGTTKYEAAISCIKSACATACQ